MHVIKVYSDGSCLNTKAGNKPMGCGVYIEVDGIPQVSKSIPINSLGNSNTSEYHGLLNAITQSIQLIEENFIDEYRIIFHIDSRFVCNHFNTKGWTRQSKYDGIKQACEKKMSGLKNCCVKWIPRAQNKEADKLAGLARKEVISRNEQFG